MGTVMSRFEAEAGKEALRKALAAFNRNDIRATVEALDPNIEWNEPAEFLGGGTYHGRAGVQASLTQWRANWAEGSSETERSSSPAIRLCSEHTSKPAHRERRHRRG
jgi:ketosteroid isomerase-like protein